MPRKADERQTYIVVTKKNGRQRITVPGDWKVTFGPVAPGSKGGGYNGQTGLCLRFYESDTKQRACFVDVVEFRRVDIAVEQYVTRTEAQTVYKDTPEGRKQFVVEANISEWRDPDEIYQPQEEFRALPQFDDESDEEVIDL